MKKKKDTRSLYERFMAGESINPKKEDLTIEKFKELTGQPDMSDAEAQEYIWQIGALSWILIDYIMEEAEKEAASKATEETNKK